MQCIRGIAIEGCDTALASLEIRKMRVFPLFPFLPKLTMVRTLDSWPYTFQIEYLITGYHTYKDNWQYTIGEEVRCERETGNVHDPAYAVRLTKGQMTIGHIPRDLSKTCTFIILSGGVITAKVIGPHQNKINKGLEIPCI